MEKAIERSLSLFSSRFISPVVTNDSLGTSSVIYNPHSIPETRERESWRRCSLTLDPRRDHLNNLRGDGSRKLHGYRIPVASQANRSVKPPWKQTPRERPAISSRRFIVGHRSSSHREQIARDNSREPAMTHR